MSNKDPIKRKAYELARAAAGAIRKREYYLAHREEELEKDRLYREANKEKIRERDRIRYHEHGYTRIERTDEQREKEKAHRAAHKELYREHGRRRRERIKEKRRLFLLENPPPVKAPKPIKEKRIKLTEEELAERRRARHRLWARTHKKEKAEYHKIYNKKYREDHPSVSRRKLLTGEQLIIEREKERAAAKRRREKLKAENPELYKARRAAKRKRDRQQYTGSGKLRKNVWLLLCEVCEHRCVYCLQQSDDLTQDHVIPRKKGGGKEPENILPACRSCNSRKGALTLEEFGVTAVSHPHLAHFCIIA